MTSGWNESIIWSSIFNSKDALPSALSITSFHHSENAEIKSFSLPTFAKMEISEFYKARFNLTTRKPKIGIV